MGCLFLNPTREERGEQGVGKQTPELGGLGMRRWGIAGACELEKGGGLGIGVVALHVARALGSASGLTGGIVCTIELMMEVQQFQASFISI